MQTDSNRLDRLAEIVREHGQIVIFEPGHGSLNGAAGIALGDRSLREALDQCAIALPSWKKCKQAIDRGDASDLERFIYDNEPQHDDAPWRAALASLLGFKP